MRKEPCLRQTAEFFVSLLHGEKPLRHHRHLCSRKMEPPTVDRMKDAI